MAAMTRRTRNEDDKIVWVAVPFRRGPGRSRYSMVHGTVVYVLSARQSASMGCANACRAVPVIDEFRIQRTPDGRPHETVLANMDTLAESVGYSRTQLWRQVKNGVPHLTFDGKKWFLGNEYDSWIQSARTRKDVRGPARGAKPIRSAVKMRARRDRQVRPGGAVAQGQ